MGEQTSNTLPAIRKTIVIDRLIESVWEAVATSEGIEAWFMPNTFKPVLGQEFVLHAGPYGDSPCKVTELEPPHRLSFSWDKDWTITFELKSLPDGKTEFTLIHDGWDADKVTRYGQPHAQVRKVMEEGWEKKVLQSLASYMGA